VAKKLSPQDSQLVRKYFGKVIAILFVKKLVLITLMSVISEKNINSPQKNIFSGALFRLQVFSLSPSHQIFGHMHGVLNVD